MLSCTTRFIGESFTLLGPHRSDMLIIVQIYRQPSRSASANVYLQLAFLFLKPIQSVAFDMVAVTLPIPQHNSASEGRSHCNNCRLISSSFKSSLPCFQESLDCILCILVGLSHCHTLTNIWVGV